MDGTFARVDSVHSSSIDHDGDLRAQLQQQRHELETLREENDRLRRMLVVANARGWQDRSRHADFPPRGLQVGARDGLVDAILAARTHELREQMFEYPIYSAQPSLFSAFDPLDGPLLREPQQEERTTGVISYAMAGLGVATIAVAVAWGFGLMGRER